MVQKVENKGFIPNLIIENLYLKKKVSETEKKNSADAKTLAIGGAVILAAGIAIGYATANPTGISNMISQMASSVTTSPGSAYNYVVNYFSPTTTP